MHFIGYDFFYRERNGISDGYLKKQMAYQRTKSCFYLQGRVSKELFLYLRIINAHVNLGGLSLSLYLCFYIIITWD